MLKFFSSNSPISYLTSLFLLIVLSISSAFVTNQFTDHIWLSIVASLSAIIFFFFSNRLFNTFEIVERESYLFAFLVVINGFSWAQLNLFNPIIIGVALMVIVLFRIFSAYNKVPNLNYWFDVSFLTGVSVLIHPLFAFFIIAIMGAKMIYTQLRIREFMVMLLGLFLPFTLYFAILFVAKSELTITEVFEFSLQGVRFEKIPIIKGDFPSFNEFIVSVFSFFGLIFYIQRIGKGTIRERKRMYVFIVFAVLAILVVVINSYFFIRQPLVQLLLLPAIIFQFHLFVYLKKRFIKEFLFILFVAFQVVNIYYNFFMVK